MKKKTNKEFITQAKLKNVDANNRPLYIYSKTKYKLKDIPVTITCRIHGDFKTIPNNHLRKGTGCPICGSIRTGNSKKVLLKDFLKRSKLVHEDKYDYSLIKILPLAKEEISIICPLHGMFKQTPFKHMTGQGCIKCAGVAISNTEEFISKAIAKHSNNYTYNKCNYINAKTKVIVTCKKHDDYLITPNNHLRGRGCPVCKESKGELKIRNFLIANKIEYKREYSLPNSRYRYDFYLPKLNILIEYDGILHYEPIDYFGGDVYLSDRIQKDKDKDNIARVLGYILIRISYKQFNNIEKYLLWSISNYYRYKVNNKFYKNFLSLCKDLGLSSETKPIDVIQYKTYSQYA